MLTKSDFMLIQLLEEGDVLEHGDRACDGPEDPALRFKSRRGDGPENPLAHANLLRDKALFKGFPALDFLERFDQGLVFDDRMDRGGIGDAVRLTSSRRSRAGL